MQVDYIIVGQGLAGSATAVQLLKLNQKIVVFDEPSLNNSSRIAAGLFNPVTGKKMSKTWLADKIFPYLYEFYSALEQQTGEYFFHPTPLYRPFISIEEQNEWMSRAGDPAFAPYIEKIQLEKYIDGVNDPYGGLLLRQCGFLDTRKYIQAVGILIERAGTLCREVFSADDLQIDQDGFSYRDLRARRVIFCSGVHNNKFFDRIPIRPLKGETLSIRSDIPNEIVINRGVYMVPDTQNGTWRVGSTYNFHDQTTGPTREGREELESKISGLIDRTFEVIDHQWGFRPTTPDRRPILGSHPEYKNLIMFNGLGTKGVSLAPYFSEVLIHSLEKEGSIHKDVDIDRFN
jgi:glycine oxidase